LSQLFTDILFYVEKGNYAKGILSSYIFAVLKNVKLL